MEKLKIYLRVRDRRAEETLEGIKQVLGDDDLISPQDKLWEIIKIAAPGLRIESWVSRIFGDTADLMARHLLYRQNLLHLIWINLIKLGGVRRLSENEEIYKAAYWAGALSVMNEVADAAQLLRLNSFMGRPDHPISPEEFLMFWVELAERLYLYFFIPLKPSGGWSDWKGLQILILEAARDQPNLEAILKEKEKLPVILDDGTLKDWIRIKTGEHDRVQAHFEADRILIDHLISLGYVETGAAFRRHIALADSLHSFKEANEDLERGPE
jgi:hypothetical protein